MQPSIYLYLQVILILTRYILDHYVLNYIIKNFSNKKIIKQKKMIELHFLLKQS